ncbi:MAG: hypothetical protein ACYCOO_02850 [Chitinophagaceae bacterium]
MKRLKAIILVLFYFTVSAGAELQYHYCDGHWMSPVLSSPTMSCCQGKMMNQDAGCCQHPILKLKITRDQQVTGILEFKAPLGSPFPTHYPGIAQKLTAFTTPVWKPSAFHAPPFSPAVPTYIAHSDFRI